MDEAVDARIGVEQSDVVGCEELTTHICGDGQGHPSCEAHARSYGGHVYPPLPSIPSPGRRMSFAEAKAHTLAQFDGALRALAGERVEI